MTADGRARKVSKGITGPSADKHNPHKGIAKGERADFRGENRLRHKVAQKQQAGKRETDIDKPRPGCQRIQDAGAAAQQHTFEQHHHDDKRAGKRQKFRSLPSRIPHESQGDKARKQGNAHAPLRKSPGIFKPGQKHQQQRKSGKNLSARLNHKGSSGNAHYSSYYSQ